MPAYEIVDAPSQHEDREGWLAARRTGIGSSDAPAVCGLSPWSTPLGVYADKVWAVEDERDNEAMELGRMLEESIGQLYTKRTRFELAEPDMMRSTERPWQLANIDRLAVTKCGDYLLGKIVEIKLSGTSQGWGSDGTDDIPPGYFVQVTHQMDVYGSDVADLAALICGVSFRVYEIRLSEPIRDRMREIEMGFWQLVQDKTAPPPDFAHASTLELMKRLNVPDPLEQGTCALTDEIAALAEQHKALGEQIGDLGKQRDSLRAQIENAMGSYSVASGPGGVIVKRKLVSRKGFTVEPTSYVDFRISKGKS